MSLPSEPRNWTREEFLISTDKSLISIATLNAVFDQDYMYWTTSFPEEVLQKIVDASFCFGLYRARQQDITGDETVTPEQIGFARLATDHVTFAYLTDLYVLPEYQGRGLGGWMIDCIEEVMTPLPYLRWFTLRTSMPKSKEAYEKRLGMFVLDQGDVTKGAVMMGKKGKGNCV
ncbi:GCN5-related N-acetyltransferase (GNAT) domain-containing protein [Pochonia chlamydosporia 170]|uniref:GCN5-related N-acetyltransferase (GNAT) domain-containing protein n=1 Tax=Pochonia chlamydosporia 170 TaxID=1380566 RepID=A0A179FGG6_METCM|nr:GCN5-related N-acetyltransferase (GNAT) domain-containing protein [Pochonia chlamydosporia 170]OAQ64438.1 GCN5-related N-acetyltransferase (GNAT) domain-containing protein [Pochonia chlamydosporia 170]